MKIGVVCAPGGHLVQALAVLEAFKGHEIFLINYDSAALEDFKAPPISRVYLLKFYGATNFKILINLLASIPELFKIFSREKPDILFSTGSEIAVPAFFIAKFLYRSRLIFLETVVRSRIPTLTARAVYPVTDLFLVQWEHMARKIGRRARYVGSIL